MCYFSFRQWTNTKAIKSITYTGWPTGFDVLTKKTVIRRFSTSNGSLFKRKAVDHSCRIASFNSFRIHGLWICTRSGVLKTRCTRRSENSWIRISMTYRNAFNIELQSWPKQPMCRKQKILRMSVESTGNPISKSWTIDFWFCFISSYLQNNIKRYIEKYLMCDIHSMLIIGLCTF